MWLLFSNYKTTAALVDQTSKSVSGKVECIFFVVVYLSGLVGISVWIQIVSTFSK